MLKIILLLIAIAVGFYLLALLWVFILEHWVWFLLGTVAVVALVKLCMDWDKIVAKCKLMQNPKPAMTIATMREDNPGLEITTEQEYQQFLETHTLVKSFFTRVVGVTYPNDDGTDRQEILSRCLCGDPVVFYWHDFRGAPACAVITDYGQIGYLRAELAEELSNDCNGDDYIVIGNISDITGGVPGMDYGCNIMVSIYGPISKNNASSSVYSFESDELFPIAVNMVLEAQRASITMLQRKLHIGYARAARLIDEMEEKGIIGPFQGSTPREVLIEKEKWNEEVPAVQKKSVIIPPCESEGSDDQEITGIIDVAPTPVEIRSADEPHNDVPVDSFAHIRDEKIMAHYIVLDIETTGFSRENDRIIELAAIHYAYGTEVERYHTYVNPQIPIPKHITNLTGIRQSDVDAAPVLDDIAGAFRKFIKGYPLVGHNIVDFDWPFLTAHLFLDEPPLLIDTLKMSRTAFPLLPSHKLSNLNFWFHLDDGAAHRADADATATNGLLWACLYPDQYEEQYQDAIRSGIPKSEHTNKWNTHRQFERVSTADIKPNIEAPATSGPLCGKRIVFTGELSISRNEAMQLAVNAGALLRTSVSSKTDFLVVGKQDFSVVGADGMSSKEEKAHELIDSRKGCVQIINESEFMDLIKSISKLDPTN